MSYQYHPAPKPSGGFTTRVVLGDEVNETALDAAVAAATGVPAGQCPLVLKAYLNAFLRAAQDCGWARDAYGLLRVQPTSGGVANSPDGFHTADDINADVNLSFTAETIRAWRAELSLQSMGQVGWVTPRIDSVISQQNNQPDHYQPGTLISIRGAHLAFDKAVTSQGVFLTPAGGGTATRATIYGGITDGEILVLVPATLSGPLRLSLTALVNGAERSATYTNPIS